MLLSLGGSIRELQTEVEQAMTEVSADLSSSGLDNGDFPLAEQEGQDASEQKALATAVPDVEVTPRAEQKGQVASEQEVPELPVTGVPLPAGLDSGFFGAS